MTLGWTAEIVRHPPRRRSASVCEEVAVEWVAVWPPGLHVLPRRWVVERTLSWMDQNCRLSKDDERLCTISALWIYVVMIRLMVRRLARA